MSRKVLLIILDGLPWRSGRRLMGNLEGWVERGIARVWRHLWVRLSALTGCHPHSCSPAAAAALGAHSAGAA